MKHPFPLPFLIIFLFGVTLAGTKEEDDKRVIVNPYHKVNWSGFKQYKAALHLHTLQSDGYQMPVEVVETYRKAGFSILAITDHDWNYPNSRVKWGEIPEQRASPYPKDPKPPNYPANPTWPWNAYGGPKPEDVGMVGIQANELTFRHHINSYFSDYGVWYEKTGAEAPYKGITDDKGNEIREDDMLLDIKEKGGIAILNHPGISDEHAWWERKSLDWYIERFRKHSPDVLIGMEVTNERVEREKYDEGLWDQLLSRFMPDRPIWGFGADDMHNLEDVADTYTVFLLDELTGKAVREAMIRGQFYFCKSTRRMDIRKDDLSVFPVIKEIRINSAKNKITIAASGYDKITWISAPEFPEPLADYKTSDQPWALGSIVGEGETLQLSSDIKNYVRAELIKTVGKDVCRTFSNPFGIKAKD